MLGRGRAYMRTKTNPTKTGGKNALNSRYDLENINDEDK